MFENVLGQAAEIMGNVTRLLPALYTLLLALGKLCGFVLAVWALMRLCHPGTSTPGGHARTVAMMIAAILSFHIDVVMLQTSATLLEAQPPAITAYVDTTGEAHPGKRVFQIILLFVNVLGWYAMFRGVLSLCQWGTQGWSIAQGLLYLLGGTLCANIQEFVRQVGRTAGVPGLADKIL